jgi:hypothetical protein
VPEKYSPDQDEKNAAEAASGTPSSGLSAHLKSDLPQAQSIERGLPVSLAFAHGHPLGEHHAPSKVSTQTLERETGDPPRESIPTGLEERGYIDRCQQPRQ